MNIDKLYLSVNDGSYVDVAESLGFFLKWRRLSAPEVKMVYDEIPGANSSLDSTEQFGEVFYRDRLLELGCKHPDKNWYANYQSLLDTYHGQKVKIKFGNDPNYYWTGRLFVSEYDSSEHELAMSAIVYPYKFKGTETTVTAIGYGSGTPVQRTVSLANGRMKVVPTVTINAEAALEWGNYTKTISASSYPHTAILTGLVVNPNETLSVKVTSAEDVVFTYREGAL